MVVCFLVTRSTSKLTLNQNSIEFLFLFRTVKFDCSNRHFYISDGIGEMQICSISG